MIFIAGRNGFITRSYRFHSLMEGNVPYVRFIHADIYEGGCPRAHKVGNLVGNSWFMSECLQANTVAYLVAT